MAKKILKYTITSEIIIDTNEYDSASDNHIKQYEKQYAQDWFFDNIKSEKMTIKSA